LVLDAYALLAYFRREPGGPRVASILRSGDQLFMTSINLGEVYYKTVRRYDVESARQVMALIARDPIEVIDLDRDLVMRAAYLKGMYPISYTDCFAAALAMRMHATLVTGDRDFQRLERELSIEWLPE
jgi:ribonuclease VapC